MSISRPSLQKLRAAIRRASLRHARNLGHRYPSERKLIDSLRTFPGIERREQAELDRLDSMEIEDILAEMFGKDIDGPEVPPPAIDAEFTPEGHPDGAFIDDDRLDDSAGALDVYAYQRWTTRQYDIADLI
jgi:hypothetical protein